MNSSLSFRDAALALAVVFVWGTNFVLIRVGLDVLPPLLFAALRFTLVLLPAVFFLPRPAVSWGNLATYGLAIGFGQFGLLFIGHERHDFAGPGLAGGADAGVLHHRDFHGPRRRKAAAASGAGLSHSPWQAMGVIAVHNRAGSVHGATMGRAGAYPGGGHGAGPSPTRPHARPAKAAPKLNVLAYVVWASLFFGRPPLYLMSFWREGWPAIASSLSHTTPAIWGRGAVAKRGQHDVRIWLLGPICCSAILPPPFHP